jgi:hypothetical protein
MLDDPVSDINVDKVFGSILKDDVFAANSVGVFNAGLVGISNAGFGELPQCRDGGRNQCRYGGRTQCRFGRRLYVARRRRRVAIALSVFTLTSFLTIIGSSSANPPFRTACRNLTLQSFSSTTDAVVEILESPSLPYRSSVIGEMCTRGSSGNKSLGR